MKTILSAAAAAFAATALISLSSCGDKQHYDATGIFEATTVTVSAETAGKILYFPVKEGDTLRVGERAALIDTTLLTLQRSQISSQRLSAQAATPDVAAQAASLRAQIAHQQQETERFRNLAQHNAGTQKQYDDAKALLTSLQGQLTALLSTLGKNSASISDNAEAIRYQREQIAEQIMKCHIMSPVSGTVLSKYAEPGEYVVPGKPLFKIADLSEIYLRSYFTASQLANVKLGQKVKVIADFGGDEQYEYPGTVTWIAQESEFTPKSIQTKDSRANLVYAVKIAVKNDGRLKLGQYGEVIL